MKEELKPRGGFRKLPKAEQWPKQTCRHPEHDPPMHIVLEPGVYEYTCPGCGNVQTIVVPEITM